MRGPRKIATPLPHIQETLESLEGSHIFSSFNFKLGFWQVEMDEASSSILPLLWGHWASLSANACHLDCVMHL